MKRKQKENKIVVQECFFVSMGLAQVYGKVQLYEKLVIYCLCQENKTYFWNIKSLSKNYLNQNIIKKKVKQKIDSYLINFN